MDPRSSVTRAVFAARNGKAFGPRHRDGAAPGDAQGTRQAVQSGRGLLTLVGGPDTIVKQLKAFHDQCGVGVVDLGFQQTGIRPPGSDARNRAVRPGSPAASQRVLGAHGNIHCRPDSAWKSGTPSTGDTVSHPQDGFSCHKRASYVRARAFPGDVLVPRSGQAAVLGAADHVPVCIMSPLSAGHLVRRPQSRCRLGPGCRSRWHGRGPTHARSRCFSP